MSSSVPADGIQGVEGIEHGSKGDPRYPSPKTLRVSCAITLDFLVHLGLLVGSFVYFKHTTALANFPTVPAIGVWMGSSFLHRTVIQWIFQATLGKALFALRIVRRTDGRRVRFWDLVLTWFITLAIAVIFVVDLLGNGSADGPSLENKRFPAIVRRRDVIRLRRQGNRTTRP
jgi:uncharacterized RDD family membrane protein YckC